MDTELRRTIRNLARSGLDSQAVLATLASELNISCLALFHLTMNVCTGTNIPVPSQWSNAHSPLNSPQRSNEFLTPGIMSQAIIDRSFFIQYGTEHMRFLITRKKFTLDELLKQNAEELGYQQQPGFQIKWHCLGPNNVAEAEILGTTIPEPGKRYSAVRSAMIPAPTNGPRWPLWRGPVWGRGRYRQEGRGAGSP